MTLLINTTGTAEVEKSVDAENRLKKKKKKKSERNSVRDADGKDALQPTTLPHGPYRPLAKQAIRRSCECQVYPQPGR